MPEIQPGEKQSSYIPRCMAYVIKNEGLDRKQAAGKCFGLWKQHRKNSKSKASILEEIIEARYKDKTLEEIEKEEQK